MNTFFNNRPKIINEYLLLNNLVGPGLLSYFGRHSLDLISDQIWIASKFSGFDMGLRPIRIEEINFCVEYINMGAIHNIRRLGKGSKYKTNSGGIANMKQ